MWRRKHINLKHVGFIQIKGNNATLKGFYSGVYPRTTFLPPHNLKDLKLQSGKKLQLLFIKHKVPKCVSPHQRQEMFFWLTKQFFFLFAFRVRQSKQADGAASPALNQYHHQQ